MWNSLFRGRLEQVIAVPKRVGRMRGQGRAIWATGDAALQRIGAINWDNKEYILEETKPFLGDVNPPHRRVIIGDDEQLARQVSYWRGAIRASCYLWVLTIETPLHGSRKVMLIRAMRWFWTA